MFNNMDKIYSFLENKTVKILTHRKALKAYEKSKKKTILTELWSWIDALIFAVVVVILLNQFLFQLFLIPSPSMVSTLNINDRVVVSKISYGVELYPTGPKIFSNSRKVQRDDIITFYNPEYNSKGPVFDILSQAIYYATLSLVNIDRNEDGSIAERLFVKRAVGFGGDNIKFKDGNVLIKPAGYDNYITEEEYREENSLLPGPHRSVDESLYDGMHAWGRLFALQENNINVVPQHLKNSYESVQNQNMFDYYEFLQNKTLMNTLINPSDMYARSAYSHYRAGIYVPNGYVLPLGDNRDNSSDGRYFGPVKESTINGKVIARFWPIGDVGLVKWWKV